MVLSRDGFASRSPQCRALSAFIPRRGVRLSHLSSLHPSPFIFPVPAPLPAGSAPPPRPAPHLRLIIHTSQPPATTTQHTTGGTDSVAYHFIDLLSPLSQVSTRIFHHFMQASPSCPFTRLPCPSPAYTLPRPAVRFIPSSPINRTEANASGSLAAVVGQVGWNRRSNDGEARRLRIL